MWFSLPIAIAMFLQHFLQKVSHCKPPVEMAPKTVFRVFVNIEPKDKVTIPAVMPDKQYSSNLVSHKNVHLNVNVKN